MSIWCWAGCILSVVFNSQKNEIKTINLGWSADVLSLHHLKDVLCPCLSRMFARRRKPTYWDYSVNCTGNEAHLSSCKLGQLTSLKSNGTCTGGLPVVVSCVPGRAFAPTSMTGFRKAFRQEVKSSHAIVFKCVWQKTETVAGTDNLPMNTGLNPLDLHFNLQPH